MPRIEQAIFTYAETPSAAGYQIVARSAGLLEMDARELAAWCPTNDALLDPDGESLNFHGLPSGSYCVSRTIADGWDCVGCGGHRSQTHCLIVPPELLNRFANNPFALLRAAMEGRSFCLAKASLPTLEPVTLDGWADAVNTALLSQLAIFPGSADIAILVAAAQEAAFLAVSGDPSPAMLMDGLLNCLPPECRLEYSFSTGLKFSPRRPFRLTALSSDLAEQLWVANHPNVTVFRAERETSSHSRAIDDWARLIERVLSTEQTAFLARELAKRRFDLMADDLPALGLQLIEKLDPNEFCGGGDWDGTKIASVDPSRAHAAHRRFEKSVEAVVTAKTCPTRASTHLNPNAPEILEQLELLDDLVYEAICGDANAMRQLQTAWPKLLAELGDQLLAESREQYLRYAMSIWEECLDATGNRDPGRAVHALDVLCLLFCDA